MKKLYKRILSLLLCVLLFGGVLSLCASAESYSGTYGTNIHWQLDTGTGVLSITGTGAMPDATSSSSSYAPWYEYRSLIKSAVIAKGVTRIGEGAFHFCSSLTSVKIPNSVTSIGISAFVGCSSLTSVTIPNSVTSIGTSAFSNCYSLTSVTIPNSVTSIGGYAFCYCQSLTSVTIPDSVTSIGNYAFYECRSLTSVTIPNSVTSIGHDAFSYCSSLVSVTIPNSVTNIGIWAFCNCSSLTAFTVDANNPSFSNDDSGVLYNKNKTTLLQYPIRNLRTSFTIPNSVTSIGEGAFSGCDSLTSITIPNSVTSIGESAFYSCKSLTSVTIPNSVTSIGDDAFIYCQSLTSVTIPNSVTSIGNHAFFDCTRLTSVTIPDSVTSIGSDAFAWCSRLTAFTVDTNNPSFSNDDSGVLYNKNKTTLLQYPNRNLRTSFTIPNSVTSIGESAFSGCDSLTSITIPNSVTSIGDHAFQGCSSLTSITIPNSVTSIGNDAFSHCSSLTSVTIPNSVTSIGGYAFYNCSSLTDVYYTGSETQWKAISIGTGNDPLTGAAIHYNSDGGTSTPSTLSTRDVKELWKPETLFASSTWTYNAELAYVCAVTCDQSKGKSEMIEHYKSLGFDENNIKTNNYAWNVAAWAGQELGCYGVAVKEYDDFNLMVVTCRGSKSIREGEADKTMEPKNEFWGFKAFETVHDIFDTVMKTAGEMISDHDFFTKNGKKTKFLFTGHSLGGATANLLAANFDNMARAYGDFNGVKFGIDDIFCYTFGAINCIGEKNYDGTPVSELPVVSGYENIHNVYNYYDTFGPNKAGNTDSLTNGVGTGTGKFGDLHLFFRNFEEDVTNVNGLDNDWRMIIEGKSRGHSEQTYIDAVYYLEVDERGAPGFKGAAAIIECPVNVEVFKDNALVCRVESNDVKYRDPSITVKIIDGDKKVFVLPTDGYSFKITAYEKGTMKCTFINDMSNGSAAKSFNNVILTAGKTFETSETIETIKLYTTNESGEKTAQILSDGTETPVASLRIAAPETATYKKSFTASAQFSSLPAGARVEWTADNAKVQLTPAADGQTCTVKSAFKGTVTLTATAYGADGETLAKQSATVTVKYAWWQWLIRIFLFGWIWY